MCHFSAMQCHACVVCVSPQGIFFKSYEDQFMSRIQILYSKCVLQMFAFLRSCCERPWCMDSHALAGRGRRFSLQWRVCSAWRAPQCICQISYALRRSIRWWSHVLLFLYSSTTESCKTVPLSCTCLSLCNYPRIALSLL